MQTGSSLLSDYLSTSEAGQNSVSLIIFLTDGRPTVGVQESALILGNARAAVRGSSCVFTIGLGNDLDLRLLERMALDNCGMSRHIHEDADASAMLKGFVCVCVCVCDCVCVCVCVCMCVSGAVLCYSPAY